jgi:hypothetical protein
MSSRPSQRDTASRGGVTWLMRIAFLVALAYTSLGLIETGFITYDFFTGALSWNRTPDLGVGIRSWTEHHAMRPGYTDPNVHTNSFGLRSPEVAVPKPTGTLRVLLLGDSFTFGLKVRDDQVFARALEQTLRTDLGSPVEVVNAGVVSYCPLLEYLQYRHHLAVLEPDLVVLNFDMSDVQDQLDYSRDTVFGPDGVPLYVTEPSLRQRATAMPGLLVFEWVGRHYDAARRQLASRLSNEPFLHDRDRYLWALDNGPDLAREAREAMEPIADLQRLLAHEHVPLLLATYPQPWQVARDATPSAAIRTQFGVGVNTVHLNDRPFQKLDAFAAEHGLPFLNATPAFRQDSAPASLFLNDDFHFSPRGHALYAELLARAIIDHGFLRARSPAMPGGGLRP